MKVIKTQKGYLYKVYKNGKKKRISKDEYLKLKKQQKGGTNKPKKGNKIYYDPNNRTKIHRISNVIDKKAIIKSVFGKPIAQYNISNLIETKNNALLGNQKAWGIKKLPSQIEASQVYEPPIQTPPVNQNTLYNNTNFMSNVQSVNRNKIFKSVRNNSNPIKYGNLPIEELKVLLQNERPYVYFTFDSDTFNNNLNAFKIFNNLIGFCLFENSDDRIVKYIDHTLNQLSEPLETHEEQFELYVSQLNKVSERLKGYNSNLGSYVPRLIECNLLSGYNQSTNKVVFIQNPNGDSLLASISMGGIILNPANDIVFGGGARNNTHEHMAYEENLCYQSNLLESLEVIYTDVCEIFKGINIDGFAIEGFSNSEFNFYREEYEFFPGYLPATQTCAISFNEFKYVKLAKSTFRKLKTPYLRMVLSIASPDMKKNNPKIHYYINYRKQMIDYWKLVISSTIRMYEYLELSNPCVVAVMPGDFIKHRSGRYNKPRMELAIAVAEALKIAISQSLSCQIVFARETQETKICKEILALELNKELKYDDDYKQTDHTQLRCVEILEPSSVFNISAHQLSCPVIGYHGYSHGNESTTFKSLAKEHPKTLFVFNDHIQGGGYGGQADIRGFRNAIGIPVGLYKDDKTFTLCTNTGSNVNQRFNLSKLNKNTHVNYKAEPTGEFYFNIPFSQALGLALHYIVLKFKGVYDNGFKFDKIVFGCNADGTLGAHHFASHGNQKLLVYVKEQLDKLSSQDIEFRDKL
jgi:hypothetical protein